MASGPDESMDSQRLLRNYEGSSWMYFTVRPRCEKKLQQALQAQNIPCYLPLVSKTTEYAHRIYTRMVPMFPGYVFASARPQGFELEKISNMLGRICFLSEPESASLLHDLLSVCKCEILAKDHKVEVMTNFALNDAVAITHGYFKGENAVIRHFKNHDEVIVQLTAIPMAVTLQLPVDFVSKGI